MSLWSNIPLDDLFAILKFSMDTCAPTDLCAECLALSERHLTDDVRYRSMDVIVKNEEEKRKPDYLSKLINSKDRMMCALFSNGGAASKHWIIWQSKVLLICEDGGQTLL